MMKILSLLLLISFPAFSQSELNLELGSVENSFNQVRIDGEDGTQFNLASSFPDSNFYYRLNYSYLINPKHGVRFLYAPLKLTGDQSYGKDINFQGVNFDSNRKVSTEYQFNSYRATYFYQLYDQENFNLRVGGTLKVRDAKVKLSQGNQSKFKKNSGIVPLLYLNSEYKWSHGMRAAFDFDGWAASQGRAFDIALMVGYYVRKNLHANIGYRMLEGGVDNEKVYNFSQLNFIFTSLQLNF